MTMAGDMMITLVHVPYIAPRITDNPYNEASSLIVQHITNLTTQKYIDVLHALTTENIEHMGSLKVEILDRVKGETTSPQTRSVENHHFSRILLIRVKEYVVNNY